MSEHLIKLKKLHPHAIEPNFAHPGDAGADLYSTKKVVIQPGETQIVPTGWAVELPKGFEWQIRPRSGLAYKQKLMVINSPGTVDSGYRGEVGVIMFNPTTGTIKISKGMKIAQAVLNEVPPSRFEVVEELSDTERDTGGFGSTGTAKPAEVPPTSKALPTLKEVEAEVAATTESEEIAEVVAESAEIAEATEEPIPETVTTTDATEVVTDTVEVTEEQLEDGEEGLDVGLGLINPESGDVEAIADIDTSAVTDNEEIDEAVTEVIEEAKSEVADEAEEDIFADPSEGAYAKFGPLVDQAMESFIKTEEGKAMLELALEVIDEKWIKTRVVLQIVENQVNGEKTVVVNELKKVLDKVLDKN